MTHDTFLQAIIDDPDDDGLRLVYADWLEERGDPRGEFIRVQIDLARTPEDDPRRGELEARERELLNEHEADWAGLIPRCVNQRRFQRGFVAGIEIAAKAFSETATLFRLFPIQHLSVLGPFRLGKTPLRKMATSPHLARLASLSIRGGYYAVGPDEVVALANSPYLGRLTTLGLYDNVVGPGGMAAIAASPHLSRLSALSVSGYGFNPHDHCGVDGVRALAASPHLTRLTTLCLPRNGVADEGCGLLAAAPNLAGLTTLDLASNHIGNAGAEALLSAPYLDRLTGLDLSGQNFIGNGLKHVFRRRLGACVRF
jgi:uncharacterized protein (TIGR02996 family)